MPLGPPGKPQLELLGSGNGADSPLIAARVRCPKDDVDMGGQPVIAVRLEYKAGPTKVEDHPTHNVYEATVVLRCDVTYRLPNPDVTVKSPELFLLSEPPPLATAGVGLGVVLLALLFARRVRP